jgi:hypothetical protein
MVRVSAASPLATGVESGRRQAGWLELIVTFAADVPPTEVWQKINHLLKVLAEAAPDLNLTYDALRSRAENGDVIIAMTPANAVGAAERLDALSAALRAAAGKGLEIRGVRLAA